MFDESHNSFGLPLSDSQAPSLRGARYAQRDTNLHADITSPDELSDSDLSSILSDFEETVYGKHQAQCSGPPPSGVQNLFTNLQIENAHLINERSALLAQVKELESQTSSLRRQVANTNTGRILLPIGPHAETNPQPLPFFNTLRIAEDADRTLTIYREETYRGQYYWNDESYWNDLPDNLTVKRHAQSGAACYLVGEDGIVSSAHRQERMRKFCFILFNTLRTHEIAPATWAKMNIYIVEWLCLSLRIKFVEFRLCEGHWKAECFAESCYV
ncbi:hypothetical protein HYDPIDRAFT_25766, partial [Hydnomerulius pinastri MD-312]